MRLRWWHWTLLAVGLGIIGGGLTVSLGLLPPAPRVDAPSQAEMDPPSLTEGEVIAAVEKDLHARGRLSFIQSTSADYEGDGVWSGTTRGAYDANSDVQVRWWFDETTRVVRAFSR